MMSRTRLTNVLRLKAGCEDEYKRRHDELWEDMRRLLSAAGIENYTIWLAAGLLFEYMETNDVVRLRETLEKNEVKRRWDDYMSDIVEQTGWETRLMLELDGGGTNG